MSEEKRRSKRQSAGDEGFWECSMCTYRNPPEFFKCEICECRKGTSTRRPRVTSQVVAQQVAQSFLQPPPPKKERRERRDRKERTERAEDTPGVSSLDQDTYVDVEHDTTEIPETKPECALSREDSVEGDREEPDIPESQLNDYVAPPPAPPKLKREASSSSSKSDCTSTTSTNTTPTVHSNKCANTKKSKSSRLKNIDRASGQSMEVTVNNITVVITDYQLKKDSKLTTTTTTTSSTPASSASIAPGNNNNTMGQSPESGELLLNSSTQQAIQERDGGESKDSFSSSLTDTNMQSSGEAETLSNSNPSAPCAMVES